MADPGSTTPPIVNPTAAVVGGFIEALMGGGEAAAMTYLVAQFPVIATPILYSIVSWVVNYIAQDIENYLINNATGIVIAIQTSNEQSNVVAAATALQMAQESGDQNAINTALANAKAAYGALINWDGTYSPSST